GGYLKMRWLLFAILFFLIHILLVSNMLPLARFSVVADRYAYLSNIGICFLVVCVFLRWYTIVNLKWRWVPATVFGIYIACLSIYSFQYVRTWYSGYTVKKRLKETIEQRSDFNQLRNKIKGNETE